MIEIMLKVYKIIWRLYYKYHINFSMIHEIRSSSDKPCQTDMYTIHHTPNIVVISLIFPENRWNQKILIMRSRSYKTCKNRHIHLMNQENGFIVGWHLPVGRSCTPYNHYIKYLLLIVSEKWTWPENHYHNHWSI